MLSIGAENSSKISVVTVECFLYPQSWGMKPEAKTSLEVSGLLSAEGQVSPLEAMGGRVLGFQNGEICENILEKQ